MDMRLREKLTLETKAEDRMPRVRAPRRGRERGMVGIVSVFEGEAIECWTEILNVDMSRVDDVLSSELGTCGGRWFARSWVCILFSTTKEIIREMFSFIHMVQYKNEQGCRL